ncbi:MAG: M48 family metallopeptidase [Cellvibrionaceae bacterium]
MNFFEHQDTARRNTRRLVILMILAVISLIAVTTILVAVITFYFQYGGNHVQAQAPDSNLLTLTFDTLSWEILGYITLGVGILVALGSTYKLLQLSGGGRTVAEAMGGRLININTRDADERKILNVVEEMAIASGTPVPPVYLIDDESINAFAAGFQPQDAVIGVTRGCIRLLSRDELQGVIAHEFSHILHGDMRLNIRLVGILHGILVIGLIGYFLLRSMRFGMYSSRRRGNSALPMLALGIGLIVIGYAGTFFGNIIKAAVSRQREFLADASAVQFTRNPDGIGGALKKIGGYSGGSLLQAPSAAEFSHMYFGQGIKVQFNALMATHPPLPERIARIEPNWNGQFARVAAVSAGADGKPTATSGKSEQVAGFAQSAQPAANTAPASAIDSIGQPSAAHVSYAHELIKTIPDVLNEAVHDPFAARAVIYSLLLNKSNGEVAEKQWQQLRQQAHPVVFNVTEKLLASVAKLDATRHLPLLELCIPALKTLSTSQYDVFKRNLIALIRADDKVDLFEWSLYRIVMHNLEPSKTRGESLTLKTLSDECQMVLSIVAHSGHDDKAEAQAAYDSAFAKLGIGSRFFMDRQNIQLFELDGALDKLKQLKPLQKPLLLKALATCITHDAQVTVTETELFRAIADSLDCPVPPLLPGQKLD